MSTDAGVTTPPGCPRCGAQLRLGKSGEVDAWSCPSGHGLGITISEAYGRVQDDEIKGIWETAKTAPPAPHACPLCGDPMVAVTVGYDADEAAEGEAGDLANVGSVSLEVCRDDAFFWFDAGELEELPEDLPAPPITLEEQKNIDLIVSTFAREIDAAYDAEESRGVLNKLANHIVREHPGFTRVLNKVVYRDAYDDLQELGADKPPAEAGPAA